MNSAALFVDPEVVANLIPFGAFLLTLGVVVAVAIAIAYTRVRNRETERDILVRRLAHDERMKELEVEALRLQQQRTASTTPATTSLAQH